MQPFFRWDREKKKKISMSRSRLEDVDPPREREAAQTDVRERVCLEGRWEDVMRLIGQAHVMLHDQGVARIQTDIRVGSR